ncbi:hypothetical protein [Microbulbifer sp. GL-2]|uniref:hypothetical protein n=1 Tax=Microbulbifer sp. GL-2 TaxID=2591606 RepID=UPI00116228B8|nr:hypothetical protein [Microbulbifer sp. GL-2]BBM00603.1 hypothetical protein GL2_06770 [Microbulbifer sp. GL-2]
MRPEIRRAWNLLSVCAEYGNATVVGADCNGFSGEMRNLSCVGGYGLFVGPFCRN